jgi:hypothetical protein
MAVDTSRPEAAVDLIATAIATVIVGTDRSYVPDAANVIADNPWQQSDWDLSKALLYYVYPGASIIGEKRTTGTQDERVLVTILAGRKSALSRTTENIPVPSPGVVQWRVKCRLAADIKRQIEAALLAGLIPGTVVEDIFYNTNLGIYLADWDIVQVEAEVRYRRQRGAP